MFFKKYSILKIEKRVLEKIIIKIFGKNVFILIQKYYWRTKDFSLSNFLNTKIDDLKICFSLLKLFKKNYFRFQFYSQQNEDKYLLKLFKIEDVQNGTYLEIGAYDGIYFSNTLFLQNEYGFSGILIEPQKTLFKELTINRPLDFLVNSAISNSEETQISFIGDNLEAGISSLSSINLERFPAWKNYMVDNKKMKTVIQDSNLKYIDVMFIDTEGSEFEIIKSINFSFPISLIVVEAHKENKEEDKLLKEILNDNGFKFYFQIRGNYWFYNQDNNRKGGLELRKKS